MTRCSAATAAKQGGLSEQEREVSRVRKAGASAEEGWSHPVSSKRFAEMVRGISQSCLQEARMSYESDTREARRRAQEWVKRRHIKIVDRDFVSEEDETPTGAVIGWLVAILAGVAVVGLILWSIWLPEFLAAL